jgi:hypothetical protein
VAAHAGDAVGDGEVLGRLVEDDGLRALVEQLALRVVQQIALKAVGQAEDRLAAVMIEAVLSTGAERKTAVSATTIPKEKALP